MYPIAMSCIVVMRHPFLSFSCIKNKLSYKAGDTLDVSLKTDLTLLPSGEVNSEKYSIIKVHNHTSLSFGATQVSIDDLDGLK